MSLHKRMDFIPLVPDPGVGLFEVGSKPSLCQMLLKMSGVNGAEHKAAQLHLLTVVEKFRCVVQGAHRVLLGAEGFMKPSL